MSQTLFDDLEEGEIADDILPEPEVVKKHKALPRRYVINDKKITTKHKKNCKHAVHHHKRKTCRNDLYIQAKLHKKHHKACSKHLAHEHVKNFNHKSDHAPKGISDVNFMYSKSHYNEPKSSFTKSAFKNFRSPPRKISKVDNSNLNTPSSLKDEDSFPKLLLEYKNSRSELSKFKNISNMKENNKFTNQISQQKNENIVKNQLTSENTPPLNNTKQDSDDEDVEELRRIALATCSKRSVTDAEDAIIDGSSNSKLSPITASDNYEVVDMEVDNDVDKSNVGEDLFIIDTTPTYECAPQSLIGMYDTNPNIIEQKGAVGNGFLSLINMNNTFQNISNDILNQNLTNNLCSNFHTPVENCHPQSSQLDEDFEEELLRAELIANINSTRFKDKNCSIETIIPESKPVSYKSKVPNSEIMFREERTVKFNEETENHKTNHTNERIVSIENDESKNNSTFKERTVSIVGDKTVLFNDKTRNVSTYQKVDLHNAVVSPVRKAIDIKVKVNNVQTSSSNSSASSSAISLPQERIIISLNNESSSEESDLDDSPEVEQPNTNSAVASLEALIVNARNESDEKKDSVNSSNALSWLSKAQREEYNSLIKILAKNKEFPLQPPQEEVKKVSEDSGLLLLKKKMFIAQKNFEKEKELMNSTAKEVRKKKLAYITSKLRTQHLKEQLLSAERIRKSNLLLWNKCSKEYQTLKNSVSKRQAIMNSLQVKINSYSPGQNSNGLSPLSNLTPEQDNNIN